MMSSTSTQPPTLQRSVTPSQVTLSPSRLRNIPLPNRLVKSSSSSQIKEKAKEQQPGFSRMREDAVMDTRTPSPSNSSAEGMEAYQPDLSKEVAMLSTKLVNAINYQTNLDDSLQATRHELERSQQESKRLQAEKQTLDDEIAQGVWVKKSEMDAQITKMRAELAQEKEKRETAEKVKRQTDGELESLTSSLFEEANKMVAEARRDTDTAQRRNSQLRGRLTDQETLLASQQEQLQDLKLTMEALERTATNARDSSVPSTPVNNISRAFEAPQFSPTAVELSDIPPNHPLHFSQVLQPVLRNDIAAYTEFAEILTSARKAAPHSRNASGNMTTSASSTNLNASGAQATGIPTSSPSLPGAFSFTSSSTSSSPSASSFTIAPALKDSKFYKRCLTEDIDPTLRLDLAPGLSFLSRRSVQSSLLNGTLIVEPFAPTSNWKMYAPVFPCALCGESRKEEKYTRKHRFRTSEAEEAQRYPVCDFCVQRVRSAGDFVGFLRMVREGVWRLGDGEGEEEGNKAAWEEAVRLRERMFWARIGGGVVPANASKSMLNGVLVSGTPHRTDEKQANGGGMDGSPERRSRRSTAEAPKGIDGAAEGGLNIPDVEENQLTVKKTTRSDSKEALEAQAKELKRRTMLHLGEGAALSPTLSREDDFNIAAQSAQNVSPSTPQQQPSGDPPTLSRAISSSSDLDRMVSAEKVPMPDIDPAADAGMAPPPVPPHREGVSTPTVEAAEKIPNSARTEGESSAHLAAPAEAGGEKRRPSSTASASSASSVLARVRAMEAKKAGQ